VARAFAIGVLLTIPACDLVFSLDRPDPTFVVDGQLTRQFIGNDATFAPQADVVPYTEDELTAEAILADGRIEPVEWDYSTGRLSFLRARDDQRYRLVLHFLEEDRTQTYDSDAPHLLLADTRFGHVGQVPAVGATLSGAVNGIDWADTTKSLVILTTGVWTQTAVDSVKTDGTFEVPWINPRLSAAANDRVYVSVLTTTPPEIELTDLDAIQQDIGDGSNSIVATPMPLGAPSCFGLIAQRSGERTRLEAGYPKFPSSIANWLVLALATPELGAASGLKLAASSLNDTTENLQVNFHQPFPGLSPFVAMVVGTTRVVDGIPLTVSTSRVQPIDLACPGRGVFIPSGSVPIPLAITLQGNELIDDEQQVTLGDGPPVVSWETDTSDAELYVATLFELGDMTKTAVASVLTTGNRAELDSTNLVKGHRYVIEVISHVGFPNVPDGDFATLAFPLALAHGISTTFVID